MRKTSITSTSMVSGKGVTRLIGANSSAYTRVRSGLARKTYKIQKIRFLKPDVAEAELPSVEATGRWRERGRMRKRS